MNKFDSSLYFITDSTNYDEAEFLFRVEEALKGGDEQFEIDDNRSLDKMYRDISDEGLQPVLNDYLYV